jgi:hypothetical protein
LQKRFVFLFAFKIEAYKITKLQFLSGDPEAYMLHAKGVIKMNGELDPGQGPGGCLGYFLRWMVYKPRTERYANQADTKQLLQIEGI